MASDYKKGIQNIKRSDLIEAIEKIDNFLLEKDLPDIQSSDDEFFDCLEEPYDPIHEDFFK